MKNIIVRLLEIGIVNLKNVKNGKISFLNSNIKETLTLQLGDILGIYGQNGSGKTTVIEALSILKSILVRIPLDNELKNLITYGEKNIELLFKFYIEIENKKYIVEYKVIIGKTGDNTIEILSEIIKYSIYTEQDKRWKNTQTLIETPFNENIINSKKYNKNFSSEVDLLKILISQGISQKLRVSSIFSQDIKNFLKEDTDLIYIIEALEYYGNLNLFIVSNKDIGMITLNLLLPLKIKNLNSCGDLPIQIDKNESIIVNQIIYPSVEKAINEINIVLKRIIPDLQLKIEEQRKETLPDGNINIIADLRSIREGKSISLRYESEGIKRIISILGVLIAGYNQPSVCLAIDELDSRIFEYLLGEILEVLSSEIKGQLIFTSHNLRILEKIDKKNIVFSTTNPENRYIRFKYIKPNNNLRDMYLRELIIQEQAEQLYKETKQSDIKRAFYRAGVANEKES
ncbi:AAA family ATPase [Fusobacterium canifelinum]|uniref:AAA family ATPase n=1 Tax=Fusobacterium canifelinum TaxID=285729 RepID=A0ABX7CFZ7_9FUSO|nr:AAA family ATPase [Fusobacterium canifelinum]QQS88021.1 AAA family ATPase [Fusobacterium canifelinum]